MKKLAGWKANLLSVAGGSILIQASTSAILAYVMQSNFLPGRILDGIGLLKRNFLWNSLSSKQSMHWVGWRKVTTFKDAGQALWNQVFLFGIWLIWKGRNQLVFENKRLNPNIDMDITYRAVEYTHYVDKSLVSKHRIMK
ncbi:hypothetical protein SO802_028223 [Lithocarpus litseifolius]|uniref:Uncharacterized protein n=1 Tax=Lithocarpus litseifolius TaxID=425828 RepID=A0AAW2BPQ0_9ROSI